MTGLDASVEAVAMATQHAAREPTLAGRLHYVHGSLEELQEKEFDAVVASEVIEHMTSARQCIALCSAMLKVRGYRLIRGH